LYEKLQFSFQLEIFWGANALFILFNAQANHFESIILNSIAMFSLKRLHPGGIRTGSSVPYADAMSTAPPLHEKVRKPNYYKRDTV
jgi:hypothetical protein